MASENTTRTDHPLMAYAFPVSMALLMCYGMELYNHLLMGAGLSMATLFSPFSELLPMSAAVVVIEHFIGGHIVDFLMARIGDPEKIRLPYGMVLGTVTCVVMCPLMSMVATLVFKHPTLATIAPIWFSTFAHNLPFALAWALLVARPISGAVVGRLSR